ncbi:MULTISPECIES: hypothetical protein [unclassified Flavobacterium]|uniref:hypothetical protein n=1 Tax=unclassified Flavobacterium TaxID=196869 RepID=UPI0036102C46
MNDLSPTEKLSNLIAILEIKQRIEYDELKNQFEVTLDNIKPSSILTSAVSALTANTEIKPGLFNSLLGITIGFISNKLIKDGSNSFLKKFAGLGIQYISNTFLSKK